MQPQTAGSTGSAAGRRVRLTALTLVALHLSLVSWLALRPLSVVWVAPGNMQPFATISADLGRGPLEAVGAIGGGMLRLAPLGVLLPLLGRDLGGSRFMSFGRTVFAGVMVSLALEYCQSVVPSRVADIDSVILDTAGIALTHQLVYGALRRLRRARHDAPPPLPPLVREAREPSPGRADMWTARRVAAMPRPAPRPAEHDTRVLSRLHA
ncbi:VanZ family protein [Streptomyces sp. NPDC049881]|uniref:VanZ family protein n=1 Tax=Streptomyces sp. NPDC049881 TaxID=3155778 RepID=UPI003427BB47